MADKPLSSQTLESLGKKMDEFAEVLSTEEQAVLLGLLGLAGSAMESSHAQAEAEGATGDQATVTVPSSAKSLPQLSVALKGAFRSTSPRSASEVEDAVSVGWLCVGWSKDYNVLARPDIRTGIRAAPADVRIPGLKTNF